MPRPKSPLTKFILSLPSDLPAKAVVEQAKENDVGTIVMGNRGHSELESLIVGSTAHKVLHLADRPVLVIR